MENINNLIFPLGIYSHGLKTINSVKFSKREIDILACILSGKSAKGIAHFLSIAPKTAEAHTYNIMKKLDCTSREGVISLIETSGKFLIIKKYYISLLTQIEFEKSLKKIADLRSGDGKTCLIIRGPTQKNLSFLFQQLKSHLSLAGIKAGIEIKEKIESIDFPIPDSKVDLYRIYILSPENQEEGVNKLHGVKNIYFSTSENYYLSFFEILKKLLPYNNFVSIITDFKQQYELTNESAEPKSFQENSNLQQEISCPPIRKSFAKDRKWSLLIGSIAVMSALGFGLFIFKRETEPNVLYSIVKPLGSSIRSDLILPNKSTLLNRPDFIAQIDNKFKGSDGIQTIAIAGMGGAGKTTTARYYAHQQKEKVIWEINAETKESLSESFENLAFALAKNEEDKGILREIGEIKNSSEREKNRVQFVKDRLKLHSNWLLIYDNVEKFKDVQKYFPLDPETWGAGRIIITTRDSNIQNNNAVNQFIQIGELNKNQKLNLFMQIMTHGENWRLTPAQTIEITEFLERIPPFPLDISVAAYYLKTANISYAKYLESLRQLDDSFTAVQESLLKEAGEYSKTRYSIITLSLKKLMDTHKDFGDLLLLISLLDSQNIPKDLLDHYKNPTTVDNFIHNLKKYSLITTQSIPSSAESSLSIHRSIHHILLDYFTTTMSLTRHNTLVQPIVKFLENYTENIIDKEELLKAKLFISHLETFLTHKHLLTESNKGRLEGDLGSIFTSLGISKKGSFFLEKALTTLKKDQNKNYDKIAQIYIFQGKNYNILADLKKSEMCIKKSLLLYKKHTPQNHKTIALGLAYLGNVYRWKGEHEKAKLVFQESLNIYESIPPQGCTGKAMTLIYLGEVYRKLGQYMQAKAVTEKGLEFCKKYLPKGSVRQATAFTCLGIIEREVGQYQRAIKLMNEGITLTEKNFSKNSIYVSYCMIELAKIYCELGEYIESIELILKAIHIYKKSNVSFNVTIMSGFECLGNAYRGLRNYEKAKTYLTSAFRFIENKYGQEHLETAQVLESLGQVHLLEGHLKMAEEFFGRALNICQKHNHPNAYKCFESFSALHLKKSEIAAHNNDTLEAQNFKTQALNNLRKALEIVKAHFPADSPHITRIQGKLKRLG